MMMRNKLYVIIPVASKTGERVLDELKAYTTTEHRVRGYIDQYHDRAEFAVYEFNADNIFEVVDELYKMTHVSIEKEDSISMLVTKSEQPVYVTISQLNTQSDYVTGEYLDTMLQVLLSSLHNLFYISKYVKDPKFKSIIEFLYKKYYIRMYLGITIGENVKYDVSHELSIVDDNDIPYDVDEIVDTTLLLKRILLGEGF